MKMNAIAKRMFIAIENQCHRVNRERKPLKQRQMEGDPLFFSSFWLIIAISSVVVVLALKSNLMKRKRSNERSKTKRMASTSVDMQNIDKLIILGIFG